LPAISGRRCFRTVSPAGTRSGPRRGNTGGHACTRLGSRVERSMNSSLRSRGEDRVGSVPMAGSGGLTIPLGDSEDLTTVPTGSSGDLTTVPIGDSGGLTTVPLELSVLIRINLQTESALPIGLSEADRDRLRLVCGSGQLWSSGRVCCAREAAAADAGRGRRRYTLSDSP
jgi:hypothetical protein